LGATSAANAVVITTTTPTIFAGSNENAGTWKATTPANQNPDNNSNYITGFNNTGIARSFFSFDISSLSGLVANGVSLQLRRFNSNAGNDPTETLEFWDVSTDPTVLNANGPANLQATIDAVFADLGGGVSYGQHSVPGTGATGDILTFALDADAVNDLNAKIVAFQSNPITANRYFSIGADMITNDGNDGIFGASNLANGASLPRPTLLVDVPEPTTLAAFGFGLIGLSAAYRRRRNDR
jgi:hypothetical protein